MAFNASRNATVEMEGETNNNVIGLLFALSSSVFIGTYWILNKKSLENLSAAQNAYQVKVGPNGQATTSVSSSKSQPSEQIYHQPQVRGSNALIQTNQKEALKYEFLTSRLWWFGMLCMALGELANFAAYQFSAAALVTPLGALSVVVTCILSEYFLDEKMNIFSKLGVLLAILGSIFIVVHAPKTRPIQDLRELKEAYLFDRTFVVYVMVVILVIAFLLLLQKKQDHAVDHYFYKILLASLAGGFCVTSTKCLGIALKQLGPEGGGLAAVLTDWLFYVIVLTIVLSMGIQIVQITRALNTQTASTVMPIFYVTFTISVVTAMNVLFKEYQGMDFNSMVSVFIGFSVLCCAVFLLRGFRDLPVYKLADIDDLVVNIRNYHMGQVANSSRESQNPDGCSNVSTFSMKLAAAES